ncbi:hypothetical protein [Jeotgalibacillus soli]|uniref:Uncharacterized protein n=1 Tax=Jeotgalibacillus soli TaxID=889306 RepID=A0A0C2VMN7_9BACL|nr:hypothetical protein [Jeotgalibacillus soli]KIL45268.1 hypothetical protein KP78_28120 [Jeotgalibacillus soli]
MDKKPNHYDGSLQVQFESENEPAVKEPFEITDEARKNISFNPYTSE